MKIIKNEEGIFMEIPRDKITFYGDTEKEKQLNEMLYDLSLENDSLQREIKQLENNRDKAIKKLNKYRERKDHYGLWCMEYIDNADIIHILKGDSDDTR